MAPFSFTVRNPIVVPSGIATGGANSPESESAVTANVAKFVDAVEPTEVTANVDPDAAALNASA